MFFVRFRFVLFALLLVAARSLARDDSLPMSNVDAMNVAKDLRNPISSDATFEFRNGVLMTAGTLRRNPMPRAGR